MIEEKSKKITFHIEGMHCASCAVLINKILDKQKGIKASNANFGSEMLAVDFNPEIISLPKIKEIVANLGYNLISKEKSEEEIKGYYKFYFGEPNHRLLYVRSYVKPKTCSRFDYRRLFFGFELDLYVDDNANPILGWLNFLQ